MDYRFPKKEKLKSRKLIEQLFAEGESVSKFPLKLFYIPASFEEDVKIKATVSVSKRNFRSAVSRNHIKRLMREAYRLNKYIAAENIESQYAFIFLYLSKEKPTFELIEKKMQTLLKEFADKESNKKS